MKIMQVYAARLPEQVIIKLKEFERAQYRIPRAVVRAWIRQRLEAERSNIEPVPGAEVGATTPGTDGHQTQGAGAGVNID
jgi:hypothetical protein